MARKAREYDYLTFGDSWRDHGAKPIKASVKSRSRGTSGRLRSVDDLRW